MVGLCPAIAILRIGLDLTTVLSNGRRGRNAAATDRAGAKVSCASSGTCQPESYF